MKGILVFKLPEEQREFELAQRGGQAEAVISELYGLIRRKIKYEDQAMICLEELRDWLNENTRDLNLD